jgi:RND superfamily putative drug exporter
VTERFALACARRPKLTLLSWGIAVLVAMAVIAVFLGSALTTEGDITSRPESVRANDLIAEGFGEPQQRVDEIVVVRHETFVASDAAFGERLSDLARRLSAIDGIEQVLLPTDPGGEENVSKDGHAVMIPLVLGDDSRATVDAMQTVVDEAGASGGFAVTVFGEETINRDYEKVSQSDLQKGEFQFGLPAAMIVLLIVFGTLVAGALPLLMAIAAIIVALALAAIVGQVWELSFFVVNMLTAMGLALGIDYSLFVVSRFREERRRGKEQPDAIRIAGATAARAVLFSGTAFVISLTGLLLIPDSIMRSLATGAILVGIVSVAAALTLLPAVLTLLGDGIERAPIPLVNRGGRGEARFWGGVVKRVQRSPVVFLVAGVALLLVFAYPALRIETGSNGIATLPDDLPSKQGFDALAASFPTATIEPLRIVVAGDAQSPEVESQVAALQTRLRTDPDFGVQRLEVAPSGRLLLLSVEIGGDPSGKEARAIVQRVRDEIVPAAFGDGTTEALVTGAAAEGYDYVRLSEDWRPIVILFVLGLSFVLLTLAFRSLVVSAKAIVLNLLSVAAAYGLLTAVFVEGIGNEIFGFPQVDSIEAWLPLFLFAVLFGLSMDYHVFLLSRIKERWLQTGDNSEAVRHGVTTTARLITGAALIMVVVFSGFARGDLVMFQQMGFGVAVALLIDATLIRGVLVPAAMELLGRRNWYLPAWLDWIPHVEVEPAELADETVS